VRREQEVGFGRAAERPRDCNIAKDAVEGNRDNQTRLTSSYYEAKCSTSPRTVEMSVFEKYKERWPSMSEKRPKPREGLRNTTMRGRAGSGT